MPSDRRHEPRAPAVPGAPTDAGLPVPVPPLRARQPPLALLVDYDGTIALTDVADAILEKFLGERLAQDNAAYSRGEVGSRSLFISQVECLPGDPAPVVALAEAQPLDPTFGPFASRALELQVAIEVVSDGLGFYIEPALRRLGVPPVPIVSNETSFDGTRAAMAFPYGHPDCLVCGTCKRQRVLAHQAAGRSVVFIGDGETDRYAAAYADLVFAKRDLARLCRSEGWPFTPWQDFGGLTTWLDAAVEAWRSNPASLPRHVVRPFICGPESWGPGRTDPPPR
ncbi:MAG: haloacid dehalogenase-like hydrolase [Candidatus Limnocylindrales bacterium]|jgi:2,3-diketo-5-methylthio-1-phosphopentane phosphatase